MLAYTIYIHTVYLAITVWPVKAKSARNSKLAVSSRAAGLLVYSAALNMFSESQISNLSPK
jgi:hypothetical protein